MSTNSGMNGGKVRPSRVEEAPLAAAVEHPPVRLAPAAAERVGEVMVEAAKVVSGGVVCECASCCAGRRVILARTAEALVAELRLAGWKVEPPAMGEKPLKGGV